jgi:hypothetical protein
MWEKTINNTFTTNMVRSQEFTISDIQKLKKLPYFLPYGKACDIPFPALSRDRGKLLQLHP